MTAASADASRQQLFYLTILRKASQASFREDVLAVDLDLEDPVAALDQLRFEAKTLLNLLRQTGGSR